MSRGVFGSGGRRARKSQVCISGVIRLFSVGKRKLVRNPELRMQGERRQMGRITVPTFSFNGRRCLSKRTNSKSNLL
uniref:Uncharacterized protein n=1 Tax=Oryza sativa subsp. indica TaxID=39946 RepID=A0A1B4Z157_ORYSI|nr:hypothetical protein [Oryza sativa Indica Group]